jgi:hypothetical protein
MQQHTVGWVLVGSLFLVLNIVWPAASAPPKKGAAEPPQQGQQAAPQSQGDTEIKVAKVEGFRSARFGMTEAQVLEAIRADFNIAKDAVGRETNDIERISSLAITVNDLLPGSGRAQVIYLLGYKSKKLMQVNIFWGKPVNPNPDATSLKMAASLLRNYFAQQGFRSEKVLMNGQLRDGRFVVFRGIDEKNRIVLLVVDLPRDGAEPEAQQVEGAVAQGRDPSLQLSYIENADSPDIFRIKDGQF